MNCACGCEQITKFINGKFNKYIHGHSGNVYKNGHKFQGTGWHLWKKGHVSWSEGKHLPLETKKKLSEVAKKQKNRNTKGLETGWKYWLNKTNPHMMGKKNPKWKGGISRVKKKARQLDMETVRYVSWRRFVFERDNYTCISCGRKSGELIAHHIKSYSNFPKYRYEIKNGCTLCKTCHAQTLFYEKYYEPFLQKIIYECYP